MIVCVCVCVCCGHGVFKETSGGVGEWVRVGWAGIMGDILWNLYLQSRVFFHANETRLIRICLMGQMRNMRQLIPSLVFHRADWQRPERASRRACLQNPILICLMVSGSQKSQISCQLFMGLFSGPIDAPRLINTSLRRCDYMLELLMGPWISKTSIKGVFTNIAGENGLSDESQCVCRCGILCLLSSPFMLLLFTPRSCSKARTFSSDSVWLFSRHLLLAQRYCAGVKVGVPYMRIRAVINSRLWRWAKADSCYKTLSAVRNSCKKRDIKIIDKGSTPKSITGPVTNVWEKRGGLLCSSPSTHGWSEGLSI